MIPSDTMMPATPASVSAYPMDLPNRETNPKASTAQMPMPNHVTTPRSR